MFRIGILMACLATAEGQLQPGDHTRCVEVGGRTRSYLVHVPRSCDGTKAVPVVLAFHGGGKEGSEVVLVFIENGGHTWPGREPRVKFLGKSTKNVSANDMLWEFVQKHPMKS